jgi:hypothetical protein
MGIHQYLVMGISWSRDPQGFQQTKAKSHINFLPQNKPSTHVIDATNCVKIRDATIKEEEHAHILSYQTLSVDKN